MATTEPFELTPSKIQLDEYFNNTNLSTRKTDQNLAANIFSTFKIANGGSLPSNIINSTQSQIRKNQLFSNYTPWINALSDISKSSSNTSKLLNTCSSYHNQDFHYAKLKKQVLDLCDKFIFESKLNQKKLSQLNTSIFQYLVKRLKRNKLNFKYVANFIRETKETDYYLTYSNALTDYFLSKNNAPPNYLLNEMHINNDLTLFIQRYGLNNNSTEHIFLAQLTEMIQTIYSINDNGIDNKDQLKQQVEHIVNYAHYNFSYLPTLQLVRKLNALAKFIGRRNAHNDARTILSFIIEKKGAMYDDVVFEYLWTYIENDQYKQVVNFVNTTKLIKNELPIDSKLKFWIAYSFEKENSKNNANDIYKNIVQNDPISYYAIMATKRLQKTEDQSSYIANIYNKSSSGLNLTENLKSIDFNKQIKRLKLWSKVGASYLYQMEYQRYLSNIKNDINDRTNFIKIASSILNQDNNYLDSFKINYQAISKNLIAIDNDVLAQLFPSPYMNNIANRSKNVDPVVVLSLIRQESGFNPNAKSPVGALGLMQLMPKTAKSLDHKVRINHLTNPHININLGTQYFSKLLDRYEHNLVYALSAYNAGESRVERWKNDFFKKESLLHTVESIPFAETRKYVQLIFRNIYFYKLIEQKESEMAQINVIPNRIYDISLGFKH
jgi:soluble lytic murein transglycosylase